MEEGDENASVDIGHESNMSETSDAAAISGDVDVTMIYI